jgi:hypothetical protein
VSFRLSADDLFDDFVGGVEKRSDRGVEICYAGRQGLIEVTPPPSALNPPPLASE